MCLVGGAYPTYRLVINNSYVYKGERKHLLAYWLGFLDFQPDFWIPDWIS